MSRIPGNIGLPLIGDKSYDFYKDPVHFIEKNIKQNNSRVFCTRFLNNPTAFVGCSATLKELLTDGAEHIGLGYKVFMGQIYGDNILFTDGEIAEGLRNSLSQLFTPESLKSYQKIIQRVVDVALADLDTENPVSLYTWMKQICTEICLSLFLGLDFKQASDAAQTIVSLTTTHWHGIISVPVAIKLPMTSGSTFSKALDAKDKLLKIIQEKKLESASEFPHKVQQCPQGTEEVFVNNHLLLFTSALVPKALSSILTSFMIEIGQDKDNLQTKVLEDSQLLEAVLLEVQRMYPPFLGGRRLVNKDFTLNGYKLHKGHAIVYLTYAAHRDPSVFDNPDKFDYNRWMDRNQGDKDKLFCFGAGPRCCIGQKLVWSIIETVIKSLISQYSMDIMPGQDLQHKWLPVSRPKSTVLVKFSRRTQET